MGRFLLGNKVESNKTTNPVLEKFIAESLKKPTWKTVSKKEHKAKQHKPYVDRFSI